MRIKLIRKSLMYVSRIMTCNAATALWCGNTLLLDKSHIRCMTQGCTGFLDRYHMYFMFVSQIHVPKDALVCKARYKSSFSCSLAGATPSWFEEPFNVIISPHNEMCNTHRRFGNTHVNETHAAHVIWDITQLDWS